MSVCSIKYTYTRYAGVDIEKYTRGIFEYAKEAFRELQPQMSELGYGTDTQDYLDTLLLKKDGSNFCKTDIERRAVNIPRGYQLEGLVVEINITNCDGTRHKKIHKMDGPDSDRYYAKPTLAVSGTRSKWSNQRFVAASAAAGFFRRQK